MRAEQVRRCGLMAWRRLSLAGLLKQVCFWRHETVMPVPSPQVRYEEMNGPSSVAVRAQS